jgi:hypothetical protein
MRMFNLKALADKCYRTSNHPLFPGLCRITILVIVIGSVIVYSMHAANQ